MGATVTHIVRSTLESYFFVSDAPIERRKPEISLTQTTAGAVAAICSAVVGSFFGVAGTLIGTALGSIISTVVSAVLSYSITTTSTRLRNGQLVELKPKVKIPWKKLALPAALTAAVALLVMTGAELAIGKPVSAAIQGHNASGTTLGSLSQGHTGTPGKPTTPTSTPSTHLSPSPSPSQTPTPTSNMSPTVTPTSTPSTSLTPTPVETPSVTPTPISTPTQAPVTPSSVPTQAPPTAVGSPVQ